MYDFINCFGKMTKKNVAQLFCPVPPLSTGNAYTRHWFGSSLDQVMAYRQIRRQTFTWTSIIYHSHHKEKL